MATYTYSPGDVLLAVGGTTITGWTQIQVVFDEDKWGFASDAGGDAARVKNVNKLGVITVTTNQTTPDNLVLSTIYNTDALVPVNIADTSGSTVISMLQGSVMKAPDLTMANSTDVNTLEWPLKGNLDFINYGGNGPLV